LEKLCLEGFQSGLSWRTILAKRDNFRAAFHDLIGRALIKMRTMRLPDLLGVDPASHESLARTGGFCNTSK
jgi:DNA-3-methyladenine glycosylase I